MIKLFSFNKTFSKIACFFSDDKCRETFVNAAGRMAM